MPTITCNGREIELVLLHEEFPSECLCCSEKITRNGVNFFCTNYACPDQVFERIKHAVAKGSLDIDGCGDSMIRYLIKAGVRDLYGLMTVTQQRTDAAGLDSMSAASQKFYREREKAKAAPLWRKLHALGIELVGTTMCKELAHTFHSIEAMVMDGPKLRDILGTVKFNNFVKYIDDNAQMIENLDRIGFVFSEKKAEGGPLTGKTFVITGTMMSGGRDAVQEKIEKFGGVCKSSVGKTTSYLIVGEAPGNNKVVAAKKHGVPMINEDELYLMANEKMPIVTAPEEREF